MLMIFFLKYAPFDKLSWVQVMAKNNGIISLGQQTCMDTSN